MTWYYNKSHCERSEVATQRALKAFAFVKNEQLRKWTATHPCILTFFWIMQRSQSKEHPDLTLEEIRSAF